MSGQHHAEAALPPGKTWYPLNRRLGGPHGRSGRVRKISPPPGFDPRTVQPVNSRYTDWATRPTTRFLDNRQITVVKLPGSRTGIHHEHVEGGGGEVKESSNRLCNSVFTFAIRGDSMWPTPSTRRHQISLLLHNNLHVKSSGTKAYKLHICNSGRKARSNLA
jgi:hypothetical protein